MKFLVVGDVVGKTGVERLEKELPKTQQTEKV